MNRFNSLLLGLAMLLSASIVKADFIDGWVNGFYYEQGAGSRRGLGLQYIPTGPEAGVLFAAFYTFDETTGAPFWITGAATVYAGDSSVQIPLELVEGGSFGAVIGNPSTTDGSWGTATLTMNSCSNLTWSWTSTHVADGSLTENSTQDAVFGVPLSQCVYQQPFTGCPSFATAGADPRTCIIPGGEYTQDLHLTNDTLWVLTAPVFIGLKDSADNTNSITIDPGTRIIGIGESLLGISRGAKIFAEGTPNAPIVMTGQYTASDPVNPGAAGDWGGMTINGKATINTCPNLGQCTALGEGGSGTFGGDDDHDSSGVLRYVRVQFAGILYSDENELNGIAFQGVGDGTVVENIQVHANADDAVEFFGGTVNARNLVLTSAEDDSVDWTHGWRGKLQNVLVIQDSNIEIGADNGIEADNYENDNDATPRAQPWIANATFIGRSDTNGALFRRGTGVKVTNAIFTDFGSCLDIDSAATFTNAGTPPSSLSGNLTMENTILNCATPFVEEAGDPWTVQSWFEAQPGNSQMNPMLNGPFPPADASYLHGYPIDKATFGPFFDAVDYIGAFSDSGAAAWTHGWTLQNF
ncbi:MAG: hypothetical protein WBS20_02565 [Lysobacterales bacterium]